MRAKHKTAAGRMGYKGKANVPKKKQNRQLACVAIPSPIPPSGRFSDKLYDEGSAIVWHSCWLTAWDRAAICREDWAIRGFSGNPVLYGYSLLLNRSLLVVERAGQAQFEFQHRMVDGHLCRELIFYGQSEDLALFEELVGGWCCNPWDHGVSYRNTHLDFLLTTELPADKKGKIARRFDKT